MPGIADGVVTFAANAEAIAAEADVGCAQFARTADEYAARNRLDLPAYRPEPTWSTPIAERTNLDLRAAGVRTVIWCTGYRNDFRWVHAPCFDDRGGPIQTRGVTRCQGLYFLRLHWMHTVNSGLFFGVGDDAAHLADHIVGWPPANTTVASSAIV